MTGAQFKRGGDAIFAQRLHGAFPVESYANLLRETFDRFCPGDNRRSVDGREKPMSRRFPRILP